MIDTFHAFRARQAAAIEEPTIHVTLSRGRFEITHRKFQMKLEEFADSLEQQGVSIYADTTLDERAIRGGVVGSVDVLALLTGSFSISITQVAPVLAALAAWLAARNGRKVRLKIGDVEAEARTAKEVEKLLLRAKEFQQNAASNSVTSKSTTDES
jgi:hypothetical protein